MTYENVKIIQISVLPVMFVGIWSVIFKEECKLRAVEKMCWVWFWSFEGEVTGTWSNMHSEELSVMCILHQVLTLILRRSLTGTVWFYTSTSNKGAARPKLCTKSLTRDLKRMYSRFTLVRISIKL